VTQFTLGMWIKAQKFDVLELLSVGIFSILMTA